MNLSLIISLLIYNLLFPLVFIFFLPGHFIKMIKRGGTPRDLLQRLGIIDKKSLEKIKFSHSNHTKKSIWIHAVSVGEASIACKLIKEIQKRNSKLNFILSVTTPTGKKIALDNKLSNTSVINNPIDFIPSLLMSFKAIKPSRLILIEAEIWPNLLLFAKLKKIPVSLVNARLSYKSEKSYTKFQLLVKPILKLINLCIVTDRVDVDRWSKIGIIHKNIEVSGNIKYDNKHENDENKVLKLKEDLLKIENTEEKKIIIVGSSHKGEEKLIAEIFIKLKTKIPNIFLIVAPRHFERANEVYNELTKLGLKTYFRSNLSKIESKVKNIDCLLINTTGELSSWYHLSDIVIIGKSFLTNSGKGGQNPIEAILAKKAVVFGPQMQNFSLIAKNLLNNQGAIQANHHTKLPDIITNLLQDNNVRNKLAQNGQKILEYHKNATKKTVDILINNNFC